MWRFALNVGTLTAFVCLYGFCSGVFISVMPAATSQIVLDDKLGAQLGAFSSLTAIAVFVGTPIAGSLIKDDSVPGYMPLVTYSVSTDFLFYSSVPSNFSLPGVYYARWRSHAVDWSSASWQGSA
jgi:MFS family permease